ncbi:cobalt transport protein [Mobiluncus mulieris FB024-16]|uniref:ATP-binding cassette domain-containing protein n=1 Tax=Mobiluncus mulieris TaxID=2052 RepID=UPI0001E51D8E|nr:ATP-binding cassette domain-containing protein [Mobiluncus mulieris]EFN93562.1 cobalt transport protein [Mobiluncus mulieris FB024-16]
MSATSDLQTRSSFGVSAVGGTGVHEAPAGISGESAETGLAPRETEATGNTAQVTVKGLSVRYLGQDKWVLDEVNLEHLAGQVTAIVGPSGCGKTTLVRTICGLIPHCLPSEYAGSVRVNGTEIADASVQFLAENVAYVGQNPDAAVITRSVHDDIAFPLQNLCVPVEEIEARVVEATRLVGLADRLWDDPWILSGGGRQRLAIAAAAVTRPKLLVLDEPTSTIDTQGRVEFYDLVARLVSNGTGVVLIDHDLDPVLPICDQVIALDSGGRIIAAGSPREVFFGHSAALAECGIWLPRAVRGGAGTPARKARGSLGGLQVHARETEGEVSPRFLLTDGSKNLASQSRVGVVPCCATSASPALTCAEAGIELPQLSDLCDEQVSYWRKTTAEDGTETWERESGKEEWNAAAGAGKSERNRDGDQGEALVWLEDFEVPGRSPAIDLELHGGEFVAIVGPNGSGKTSILSALAGLVRFRAIRAQIAGKPPARGRHRVGYVFQNPEHQMVASTVERELAVGGTSPETVAELLENFHLTQVRAQHPLTLSGGQLRRLSVATMVAEKRQVIVLDEPTYGQDWANTCELMDFIQQLRADGRVVLMATHDLELALANCTHLVALPQPASITTSARETPDATSSVAPTAPTSAAPVALAESGRDGDSGESVISRQPLMNQGKTSHPHNDKPQPNHLEARDFNVAPVATFTTATALASVTPRPRKRAGLFTGLNPVTLFVALLPLMVMIFVLQNLRFNLVLLALGSLACLAARAGRGRTALCVLLPWVVSGLLLFSLSRAGAVEGISKVYSIHDAPSAATGVGALLGLVLVSGIATDPQDLLITLSTTFKVPYRVTSTGTAAVAFVARFTQDFRLLRVAKALRGIGKRFGPLGSVQRWVASLVPLMILAVQHGERVALSMDSRGFGARPQRTELHQVRWRVRDWALMVLLWGICVPLWVWL